MIEPITVVLLGEPVAFARTRINGTGAHFTPTRQRNTAAALRIEAQQVMLSANHGVAVFDEPLRMDLTAEFSVPASWSKRKRASALTGATRPDKRPDIDNLYKLAADALNGVVYRDDALIVEARLSKVYSATPKIVITVQPAAAA
jgi:Holliday junction resolvase RusA-like endonuclease